MHAESDPLLTVAQVLEKVPVKINPSKCIQMVHSGLDEIVAAGYSRAMTTEEMERFGWTVIERPGVYFIRLHDFIKIGQASCVVTRASILKPYWPIAAQNLGYIPEQDTTTRRELESEIHELFGKIRHRHEWFHATPELMDYIRDHALPWPSRKVR